MGIRMLFYEKLNPVLILVLMCVFKFTFSFFLMLAVIEFFNFENINDSYLQNIDVSNLFVLVVVIGPLIETFLFQFLVIEGIVLFLKTLSSKPVYVIAILTSAIFFALAHSLGFFNIILAFFSG